MNYAQRTARDLTEDVFRLIETSMAPERRRSMIQERVREVIEQVITVATAAEQLKRGEL